MPRKLKYLCANLACGMNVRRKPTSVDGLCDHCVVSDWLVALRHTIPTGTTPVTNVEVWAALEGKAQLLNPHHGKWVTRAMEMLGYAKPKSGGSWRLPKRDGFGRVVDTLVFLTPKQVKEKWGLDQPHEVVLCQQCKSDVWKQPTSVDGLCARCTILDWRRFFKTRVGEREVIYKSEAWLMLTEAGRATPGNPNHGRWLSAAIEALGYVDHHDHSQWRRRTLIDRDDRKATYADRLRLAIKQRQSR